MKRSTKGFTLIEIVMVLILLGILTAVALPKYYDLVEKAEIQTAKAVGAEYQARLNASFAEGLLSGKACTTARDEAFTEANKLFTDKVNEKHGFTANALNAPKDDTSVLTLNIKKEAKNLVTDVNIAVPVCKVTPAQP